MTAMILGAVMSLLMMASAGAQSIPTGLEPETPAPATSDPGMPAPPNPAIPTMPGGSVSTPPSDSDTMVVPPSGGDPSFVSPPAAETAQQSAPQTNSLFSNFLTPFDYDPRGRRDPFSQPVAEKPLEATSVHGPLLQLQKFRLGELRLTGIIWDVKRPRAVIQDPEGKVHIVGPNAKIGPNNGYIAVVREGEIVVVETQEEEGKLVSSAKVVKLAQAKPK